MSISVRIPERLHEVPVISRLISEYGLTINIRAAILGDGARGDGWFSLDLQGRETQIRSAMAYLEALDLEIWSIGDGDREEGW